MAQAGTQPSSEVVTLIGRALAILEEYAIDPVSFFQQILWNKVFLDELVDLVRAREYYRVGDDLDQGLLGDFIFTAFTDKVTADEFDELMQRYNNSETLQELMRDLTPIEVSMLVMRYGLHDSSPEPLERVAEHHGMRAGTAECYIQEAEYKIRRARIDQVLGK